MGDVFQLNGQNGGRRRAGWVNADFVRHRCPVKSATRAQLVYNFAGKPAAFDFKSKSSASESLNGWEVGEQIGPPY